MHLTSLELLGGGSPWVSSGTFSRRRSRVLTPLGRANVGEPFFNEGCTALPHQPRVTASE
jgi:hypothetical protein